jgi:drug/metabolite transporter (DMT)-like permease
VGFLADAPFDPAVSSPVLAATLGAACAHAAWNSIAHAIPDKVAALTLVSAGGFACSVPLVLIAAPPGTRCWGYLAVSAMLHVAYSVLLMLSYRLGDFSQTYPLARGTSPLAVMLLAAVFAGERPGPGQFAGVALICVGLGSLVLAGRGADGFDRRAVLAAIATGLTIASYTTVDGLGVRLSGSVLGYTGWLMMTQTAVLPLAALRESSIILAAIIGRVFFHERFGRVRLAAAICVTLGIVTLYLA